jgi:hypothetical protein
LSNQYIYSLAESGNNLFAAGDSGIYMTTNSGAIWLNKNQGFGFVPYIISLLTTNDYIFAGTNGQSVWKRSLSDITGINQTSSAIPTSFFLYQNYPNPFNPSTNLGCGISKLEFVSLKIYDLLGKEVAVLVNERLAPRSYNYQFSTVNYQLPSGVYFYRLTVGEFTDTKRMLLVK